MPIRESINIHEPISISMPENPLFTDLKANDVIGFQGQSIKHIVGLNNRVYDVVYRVSSLTEIAMSNMTFFDVWCRFVIDDNGRNHYEEGRVFATLSRRALEVDALNIYDHVKVVNSYGEVLFSGFVLDCSPSLRMSEDSPALIDWLIKSSMKPRAVKLLSDGTGIYTKPEVVDVPARPGKPTIFGTSDNPLFMVLA